MKQQVAKYLLFVYLNYIKEDWDEYNKFGKIMIYPAWFIKSFVIWIISPIFLPEYFFKKSLIYKEYEKYMKYNS
jgi:hypothetical protein